MKITRFLENIEQTATHNYEKKHDLAADYAEKIRNCTTDSDMSYAHYYAHSHYWFSIKERVILNIISFFILLPAWFYCVLRGNKIRNAHEANPDLALVNKSHINPKDIFPEELNSEYKDIRIIEFPNNRCLDKTAQSIIRKSWKKHPMNPHYIYCLIRRFSEACSIVDGYNPAAVIVYGRERDFSIPLITMYYESIGIKHIGFMHGDNHYTPDKIFLRFSRYYVWDDHYINIYKRLFWPIDQFYKYLPGKLKIRFEPKNDYRFFITYYFSGENREIIKGVKEAFEILRRKGLECKVRPHPRFSDMPSIYDTFKDFIIEDTSEVSLFASMDDSKYVCGINSTVLLEGFFGGKEVVIDDVSSRERYESLFQKDYILLAKKHILLSDLIKGND